MTTAIRTVPGRRLRTVVSDLLLCGTLVAATWLLVAATCLLVAATCLLSGSADAQTDGQSQWAFTVRSPYRSLPRTEQLAREIAR